MNRRFPSADTATPTRLARPIVSGTLSFCSVIVPQLALCGAIAAQDPPSAAPTPSTQGDPPRPVTELAPVIVTATRTATDPLEVPFATSSIDARRMQERGDRTIPQALREIPGVLVQETAQGHGSPYIRGVTSFRNVMLVDGIRLNNSVFRPGPNQYWNTVDGWSLDRLEVVKGPGSVLYGSDAIGGTVQAFTRDPDLLDSHTSFFGDRLDVAGSLRGRYATGEDSLQVRGELSLGWAAEGDHPTSLLIGGTAKSFGDVEGGAGVGTQLNTGYDETDLDAKVVHWLGENTKLVFLHQRVAQNDVPRTHRTVDAITWRGLSQGSDLERSFDQNRELTYLQLHADSLGGVVDSIRASASLQRQSEVRSRVRGNGNREFQGFDVATRSLWTQLESESPIGRLTYGVSWSHDDVDSFLRRIDDPRPADSIQGPVADDATYDLVDVYLQDALDLTPSLQLLLGTRFAYARADADSVREPGTNNRIGLRDDWNALVSSGRVVWNPWGSNDHDAILSRSAPEGLRLYGGVSQGFRAPNLSDLTRFDTARSDEFEIPATGLSPEDYISYEVGAKWRSPQASAEVAYFYTDIDDQILRFPPGTPTRLANRRSPKPTSATAQSKESKPRAVSDLVPA